MKFQIQIRGLQKNKGELIPQFASFINQFEWYIFPQVSNHKKLDSIFYLFLASPFEKKNKGKGLDKGTNVGVTLLTLCYSYRDSKFMSLSIFKCLDICNFKFQFYSFCFLNSAYCFELGSWTIPFYLYIVHKYYKRIQVLPLIPWKTHSSKRIISIIDWKRLNTASILMEFKSLRRLQRGD